MSKLIPALEGIGSLKYRPLETLDDLYEELVQKAMGKGGRLEKSDSEAFIALQSWAFGKMTDRQTYNKLDKLDYILWEVV